MSGKPTITLEKVAELRREFVAAKPTQLTRTAYESDFRAFSKWRGRPVDEALHNLLDRPANEARALATRWKKSMRSNPDSTIRRRLGTLRSFSKFAFSDGSLPWKLEVDSGVERTDEQLEDAAPRDMDPPPDEDLQRVRATLQADGSPEARRLLAIFDLQSLRGIRIAEALALDVKHFDAARSRVRIRGKGRTELEWLQVSPMVTDSILAWLAVRPPPHNGPLFVRMDRGATASARRLSRTTIFNALEKLRGELKIKRRLRPHGLRHAAVDAALVDAARSGRALTKVQQWARHKSFNTTAGYARRMETTEGEINAGVAARFRSQTVPDGQKPGNNLPPKRP